MARLRKTSFLRADEAVAAVEFALILPLMLLLLLGVFELARYMQYARRVTDAAKNIAQILSQQSGAVSSVKINIARNTVYLSIPDLLTQKFGDRRPSHRRVTVQVASVNVAKKTASCSGNCYVAKPVWVTVESARTCGELKPLASDTHDPKALPSSLISGQGSLIVVDVYYYYRPLLSSLVFPNGLDLTIRRSSYVEPRLVPVLTFDGNGSSAVNCP